jgi:pimeloyl-ACP methyl ester carboxylesterase
MIPIPDKKIAEVDGRKLEYAVAGEGRPTIVFINGGGPADMDSWGKVCPEAKGISTVFAYNRFGDGHSDQVAEPQTGVRVVAALRELLRKSGLNPPYVLVGHSLGGLYANLFARLHPLEVAGVVLVDSSHPDQGEMMRNPGAVWSVINGVIQKAYAVINPTKFSEIAVFDETASQVANAGPFPDVPLVVLTAGKRFWWLAPEKTRQTIENHQRSLAAMSAQGKQVIAERSGHFVQNDQPEVVIRAIRDVVESSRK